MSLRKNKYSHLQEEESEETEIEGSFNASQFKETKHNEIPWKGILLAIGLTAIGSILLFFSFTSHSSNDTSPEFPWPRFILGCVAFIPGSYHLWLAFKAYKKAPGYSYDDIPNFD